MAKELSARYTEGEYLQNNPTWHEEDSAWKAGHILTMLERNNLHPATVCEVGCGAGEILRQLQKGMEETVRFTGYDISPQAYELAKQKENDRLRFHLRDMLAEGEGTSFDLLLVIDVFEHIEDYLGFLRGIRTRATYKLFHIPLDISVQRVLLAKPILKRRREVGHIHYFTKETALATLEDTGYEIIDHHLTAGSLDLPSTSLLYALGKLPLRLAAMINQDLTARILGGHSLMVLTR
ncbi:MAG: hypothetical protein Kow0089_20850 [Desulfobulbaceae bacterium]